MVFHNVLLLLFEPVLLEASQRGESGIGRMRLAAALVGVQVGSAMGAEAPAITAANRLHRERQEDLFGKHVGQEKAVALVERDSRIVQLQAELLVPADRAHRPVEEVEIAADLLDDRLQAAGADHFEPRVQFARDTNLPFHQFSRGANFQRVDLAKVVGMVIDRAGSVALAQPDLSYREFFNVEEHL